MIRIKLAGCSGIVMGALVILLCIAYLFIAEPLIEWVQELPLVGPWIMDVMRQLVYFPYAEYVFPLFGLFLIAWGTAMNNMKNWARMVAVALYWLGAVYVLALLFILVPLEPLARYRWWISGVGLVLIGYLVYHGYYLIQEKTIWIYAEQYFNSEDMDLPPRPAVPRKPRPGPKEKVVAPALAHLIPAAGGPPFEIRKKAITIGRDPDLCDLVLPEEDTSTSRQHAKITLDDGQFRLEDLDSANGTFVNGERISKTKLANGVEVQFGLRETRFTFRMLREKVPPAPEKRKKAAPALARLVPLGGGIPFSMTKETITIGRDPDCDLVLPEGDTSTSRRHAEISLLDGEFLLEDTSTHGTFVDGERVATKTRLDDGVEIRLGLHETQFAFQILRGKTPLRPEERAAALTEGPREEGPPKSREETVVGPTLARLVPVEKGEPFFIRKKAITIGHDPDCDLVLPEEDTSISRQHARISLVGGQFILEDLDSANGTFVNGQQVSKKWQLGDGAEIQFGLHGAKFTFNVGDGE